MSRYNMGDSPVLRASDLFVNDEDSKSTQSDILTILDLTDVYDSTPEELQDTMKMRYDPDDPNWWYKMVMGYNNSS